MGFKILYVVPFFPYPPHGGGWLRVSNIIAQLSKNNEIHLCTLGLEKKDFSYESQMMAEQYCNSVHVIQHRSSKIKAVAKQFITGKPYEITLFQNTAMKKKVEELVKTLKPDIIYCSRLSGSQFIPMPNDIFAVIDQHDLSSHLWATIYQGSSRLWIRLYAAINLMMVKLYEKKVYDSFDVNIAVSEAEEKMTKSIVRNTKVWVMPNGVDLDFFKPMPDVKIQKFSLVLTGKMDQKRNIDAAVFISKKVFPKICEKFKTAQFYIVGRNPTKEVKALRAIKGVYVTGIVPDVRPFIAAGNVVVAPFTTGSGVKHKMTIAMAMCKPIIATTNACQGLALRHQEHLIVAETTAGFVKAIIELFLNPKLCDKLSKNAYNLAIKQYDWKKIVQRFEKKLSREVAEKKCLQNEN